MLNHFKGILLLRIKVLLANALRPTFFLFAFTVIKFDCRDVKIWLKLRATHSIVFEVEFISLKRFKAVLYNKNLSGFALLKVVWRSKNDTSRVQYLTQILIAWAEQDNNFCFKLVFSDGKCHISEL